MKNFVRRGFLVLMLAALSTTVHAQAELKVTPPTPAPGAVVTVEYSDPSKAGLTVTVQVSDNSFPVPRTSSVDIPLGADGKGRVQWTVPLLWLIAIFNAPDAEEVTVVIDMPDDGGAPAL